MRQLFAGFLFLFAVTLLQAEAFHPYKIKSGKITFEKRRYGMHTMLQVSSDGSAKGSRSNPYHVEEEIIYYWDNYGDIAYEVSYQVATMGGKKLPEKVKKYVRLWKGEHRYYYDLKKKKISDDPYHSRLACMKAKRLYEVGGWLSVIYPGAKLLNKETVAGQMAKHYKESEYADFYEWNGIVLRDMFYSTKKKNGKSVRFEPEMEKVAVKVDVDTEIDPALFHPQWLVK